MFSKMLIFIICFVGFFILVFGLIPGEFFTFSFESSAGADPEVAEAFSLANVTMYANAGNDNMTYPYSSYWDNTPHLWSAGLPGGQYLEVWWGLEVPPISVKTLEFRHVEEWLFGSIRLTDRCAFKNEEQDDLGNFIFKSYLEDNYNDAQNSTIFYAACDHLAVSTIIGFNQTKYSDIGEAWDNNELSYLLSYEVDWNASAISAFTVLGKLMLFQAPDLGFNDPDVNLIFNALIVLPIYTMITILVVKLLFALFPTSPGVPG